MAFDMFYYRTSQLIMEMAQSMHGFDTIAFSAGIGENSATMRLGVAKELEWMGVKIDEEKNAIRSNEEYMIALDVAELLG
jgi:acetate kinase